jgi:hypothetical protein
MNKSYLIRLLVIPLLVSTAICITLAAFTKNILQGLTLNLAATFVGSLITVVYVDAVIRRNREAQWSRVRLSTAERITKVCFAAISSLRAALAIPFSALDEAEMNSFDYSRMRQEMIRLAENVVSPSLTHMEEMRQDEWRVLTMNMAGLRQAIDGILMIFGRDLEPEPTQFLIELQTTAEALTSAYVIFPDLIGKALEDLPPRRDGSSSVPIVTAYTSLAAKDARRLLIISSDLLRWIDKFCDQHRILRKPISEAAVASE